MNLQISEEQTMLQDAFARLFSNESTPERVRAAEPLGFDQQLWQQLVQMGTPALRVPEGSGGSGASLFDAILVAEQAGRYLASAPVIESIVATSLLARLESQAAQALLSLAIEGDVVTLGLFDAAVQRSQLIPAAAVCHTAVVLEGETLWGVSGPTLRNAPATLGATPLAEVNLDNNDLVRHELARGPAARDAFLSALEEWKLLTAASLAANARKALEDAAAYACERHAFDRLIGSYQGLAHPLADAITEVEGAQYLVWWAVWQHSQDPANAAAMVPLAYWWATQAASTATVKAMRVFGGYGVSLEYPVQLHYRRARAFSLMAGDPDDSLHQSADRLIAGWTAQHLKVPTVVEPGSCGIDFGLGTEAEEYAEKTRAFFRQHMTPERRSFTYTTGDGYDPEMHRMMAQQGLLFADWPRAWGGVERTGAEISAGLRVQGENYWWNTVPNSTDMVSKIVMHFGCEELKEEVLPRVSNGDLNFSLGYSEPSCGSDIFAAQTKAVREHGQDGDDWIINGQKMFTSQGHLAEYCLIVARTNSQVAKHAGITLFLAPLKQEGYGISTVHTLGGEVTNVTYYTDLRVPDRYRLGAVDGGTKVLAAALTMEQSAGDFFLLALNRMLRDAVEWARSGTRHGKPAIESKAVRAELARLQANVAVLDALTRRALWGNEAKKAQRFYGPMCKLFGSEAAVKCGAQWMNLGATHSLIQEDSALGRLELEARRAVAGTIYAGTSEVQRSIIAETALGLPRTRS